jgi:dephospho-CoA kinase
MKIGVTGGIGSGKSTFCRMLADLGAYVVDADALAKELMVSNPEIKNRLMETFGYETYLPDGSLNRSFLAKEAFEKNRVSELNAIVHPALFRHTNALMDNAIKNGYKLAVKEAALLLKYGRPDNLDLIIVVAAGETVRKHRAASRDGVTPDEIEKRMRAQQSQDELIALCDIVVTNDGNGSELQAKAIELFASLSKTS